MSKFYHPTTDSARRQETKWINTTIHTHDLFCDCGSAIQHFKHLIQQQEKCLSTTTTAGADTATETHVNIDDLTEKDLEDIFAENGTQDDTG